MTAVRTVAVKVLCPDWCVLTAEDHLQAHLKGETDGAVHEGRGAIVVDGQFAINHFRTSNLDGSPNGTPEDGWRGDYLVFNADCYGFDLKLEDAEALANSLRAAVAEARL